MGKKQKPPPVLDELSGLLVQLKDETDRGLALILVSWLDDALTHVLKMWMVNDDKIVNKLFSGDGPLATFSGKIDVAYALSVIGPQMHRDFHNARDIRNLFAHERSKIGFSTQDVSARCKNFKITKGQLGDTAEKVKTTRDLFLLTLLLLIGFCITMGKNSQKPIWSAFGEAEFVGQTIASINAMVVELAEMLP